MTFFFQVDLYSKLFWQAFSCGLEGFCFFVLVNIVVGLISEHLFEFLFLLALIMSVVIQGLRLSFSSL